MNMPPIISLRAVAEAASKTTRAIDKCGAKEYRRIFAGKSAPFIRSFWDFIIDLASQFVGSYLRSEEIPRSTHLGVPHKNGNYGQNCCTYLCIY